MDDDSTDFPSDDEIEQDGPLDLTVDVLDLRNRRDAAAAAAASAAAAAAAAAAVVVSASAVTPPVPSYFSSSLAGLPFFYPALGGASYSAFLESKLAEIHSAGGAVPAGSNPAMDLSALALAAAHHDAIRQAQVIQSTLILS